MHLAFKPQNALIRNNTMTSCLIVRGPCRGMGYGRHGRCAALAAPMLAGDCLRLVSGDVDQTCLYSIDTQFN